MSNEQKSQIRTMRIALARRILANRRALRDLQSGVYRNDNRTICEIRNSWDNELFTIREFIHDVEWENGLPILSKTRAEWRREGKNV